MSSTRLGKASAQQPGRQEANPSLPDSDLCSELPRPSTLRARAVTRAHHLILGSKLPARSHGVTFQQQALGLEYGLYFFYFSVVRHHFHSQFKTPSTTEEKWRLVRSQPATIRRQRGRGTLQLLSSFLPYRIPGQEGSRQPLRWVFPYGGN